jgi:hypothetical protein
MIEIDPKTTAFPIPVYETYNKKRYHVGDIVQESEKVCPKYEDKRYGSIHLCGTLSNRARLHVIEAFVEGMIRGGEFERTGVTLPHLKPVVDKSRPVLRLV